MFAGMGKKVTGVVAVAGEEEGKKLDGHPRRRTSVLYLLTFTRESQRPTPREERMLYTSYYAFNVSRVKTLAAGFPAYNVGRSILSVQRFKFREVF